VESKDPLPVDFGTDLSGNSHHDRFVVETPTQADATGSKHGGRSTAVLLRVREAKSSLRMTGPGVALKEHQYFVYIVCSGSGTLYIGMTNSIYWRALQHKQGEIEGFASKYHCDRLVYYESFDDVHKAIGREKQLKGWSRVKKIALIESKNPRWEDLAEKWGAQLAFAGESIKDR
jgi:putative endonuclease